MVVFLNLVWSVLKASILLTVSLLLLYAGATRGDDAQVSTEIASGRGVSLTEDAVRQYITLLEPQARLRLLQDPQQLATLVNGLVRLRVLTREAVRLELDKDALLLGRIELFRLQVLADVVRQDALSKIQPPDLTALAREDYRLNPDRYSTPEQVHVRHILLRVDDPEKLATQRAELEAIAERIRKGESFEALAREYSEDPGSREQGGDLGSFGRGRMVAPFEEAAFALQESGQLSEIVETRFGVHLLQLVERQPARLRPFEEVESGIVSRLRADYLQKAQAAWEQDLMDAAEIQVDAARLQALLESLKSPAAASE